MRPTVIPREQAATNLAVSLERLLRYEQIGLIRSVCEEGVEGYEPIEIRRIWSIITYQRDLGVNLAGVEMILKLRDQIDRLRRDLRQFALDLDTTLTAEFSASEDASHAP
jgi:MerR family transcriptional regulator/heat shock protein HspR